MRSTSALTPLSLDVVTDARSNRSEYQNVPLQSEEDFAAANEGKTFEDEHEYTLARLQFELSERQRCVPVPR